MAKTTAPPELLDDELLDDDLTPEPEPVAEPAPAATPTPTSIRAEWWPAAVRLPGQEQPIRTAKVFATREGLYVYTGRPADAANGLEPDFYSPILYDKTARPGTSYAARQAGHIIVTEAGHVVVQQLGGCGCTHQALKSWRPAWASYNEAWEV